MMDLIMKPKIFVLIIFLWLLSACTPDAIVPTAEVESRPTGIPTVLAEATPAAVPPTLERQPIPTITLTPEPAAAPRFDKFLSFAENESGSNSLTGLVKNENGWQIVYEPYPPGPEVEGLGYATQMDLTHADYAVATDRLLGWNHLPGGAGPGSLAVGQVFIVDVATKTVEIVVPENVVAAGWAPNGLDFAYILATNETYELRWRTSDGNDRLLAVDVPHSLRVSPDDRTVAFTRESHYGVDGTALGLYVVEVETGIETQVSPLDRAGYGGTSLFWKPHWTPDSSQIFLYAGYDDDRAPEPHPAGYVWAAVDGSFSHFLPDSAFVALVDEPLRDPENYLCLDSPPLFAANKLVVGIGECPPFGGIPETSQPVIFTLNPQTGAIALTNKLIVPRDAKLLTWDVPGESVLLVEGRRVFSQSITAVATVPPTPVINRCLDTNAVAQPLPPAKPAGLLYSEAGNLKLWQEGMATAVSLTTSGDVKGGQLSPDGALVAFVRTVPQETAELWVVSADGQNERRLAAVSLADYLAGAESYVVDVQLSFRWLPETHKLSFWLSPTLDALGDLPQEAVTVVDADSGAAVPLFGGGEVARWEFSRDGHLAATFIQDGVRLIDTATGQLLHDLALPGSGSPDQSTSFSPDGRFLAAFAASGVAIIDTSDGSQSLIPLEYLTIGAGHYAIWPGIQWLPDGRSFLSIVPNTEDVWGNVDVTFTVWQVDVEAKTADPLHTFTGDPTSAWFAANGRYLAFYKIASSQSNARELYLADLQSGQTALYDRGQAIELIQWHPNGVQFVYWLWGEKRPLLGSLCGEPVEIPGPGNDIHQLYWQTDDQFIWYAGQPDNPDDYFNSEGDWTLFRGTLQGETTQLWQYRGLYPSY
jgi:Tol biopolymer transport system component